MDIKKIPETLAGENKPATIRLNGPSGKPDYASDGTRSTIDIVGVYSDQYQAKAKAFRDAQQEEGAVELPVRSGTSSSTDGRSSDGTALRTMARISQSLTRT